jgi:hypothetical protein
MACADRRLGFAARLDRGRKKGGRRRRQCGIAQMPIPSFLATVRETPHLAVFH